MKGKIYSCYVPNVVNNPYGLNVKRLLNSKEITTYSIREVFSSPIKFFKCQVFNFNWFEKVESKKDYYFKCMLLDVLHLFGKKIIYTIHNKQPHNSEKDELSRNMMKKLCEKADVILGLCPDTKEVVEGISKKDVHKLGIVLHPNYISNYDSSLMKNYRKKYNISDQDMVFLFLGFISPYKNVELLIESFKKIDNPHIKLLIAGNPCDNDYRKKLLTMISDKQNILYDFRYIPDEEIVDYYNTSNVVIMPYHKTSSLNSGAVYLSFSLKKTVICPDIGTINALIDKIFIYHYDYQNEKEHALRLNEQILKACNDFENDPQIITQKGYQAFEYISKEHSDSKIADAYRTIYEGLIR